MIVATGNLLLAHASVTMQVDARFSSEMELMVELGFLKRHKTAESEGLSSSFFKDGSEVLGLELTKPASFFLFFNLCSTVGR